MGYFFVTQPHLFFFAHAASHVFISFCQLTSSRQQQNSPSVGVQYTEWQGLINVIPNFLISEISSLLPVKSLFGLYCSKLKQKVR